MAYARKVADRFERDWEADIHRLIIRRKLRPWWRRTWEFLKPPKYDIFALYWWVKIYFPKHNYIGRCPFPIESDNTPVPGYATKYWLLGGWKIPQQDRMFLQKGPLKSEQTEEILVHFDSGLVKFRRLVREWAGTAGAIAVFLIRVFGAWFGG